MKHYKILILAATAMTVAGCSKQDDNATTVVEELPIVELGVAKSMPVAQIKSYTATVEADNTNNIAPSQPNRIKTISVEVGDRVRRGQTLVTLDRAGIDQLKLNLDDAQREYDRAAKLLEIGAGTQQQVDQLKTKLDATRSQYENLLENTVLTSPISGVVTARNYDPGDMTGSMPILTVAQVRPIKAVINVSETEYALVHTGMSARMTFDTYGEEEFVGAVSKIMPTVDPTTRTFGVEITLPNTDGRILPGMFGRVSLTLGEANHVVVPDRAVVKQQGSGDKYIYTYNPETQTVNYVKVELGQRLGASYEVISGIQPGQLVVVVGQNALADGKKVKLSK